MITPAVVGRLSTSLNFARRGRLHDAVQRQVVRHDDLAHPFLRQGCCRLVSASHP
jgi:hypothetical protein